MLRLPRFHVVAAGLLFSMGAVQVLSMREESQTWDEALTLAAGYSALKTGDLRLIPEHPPVGKYLNALPLLALEPPLPLHHESWINADGVRFGEEFLYHNRVPAGRLLFWGRMSSVLLTMSLGAALAWWTRRRFGPAVAGFALLLFAFDPNLIAHGRYATSDMAVTAFSFLACVLWGEYLLTQERRWLFGAGLSLGLALTSKFSALFLLPVWVALGLMRIRAGLGWRRLATSMAAGLAVAALIVVMVYTPEAKRLVPGGFDRSAPSLRSAVDQRTTTGKLIGWIGARLGLRAHSYLVGIAWQAAHNRFGHPAYLFGQRSQTGWWYFFPAAFAVKAPTALLAALALAAGVLMVRGRRNLGFEWYVAVIPTAVYLAFSIGSQINIGLRHLLPVFPFLEILAAAAVAGIEWPYRRASVAALSALMIAESAAIYPHYLAFFNVLAGGPGRGPRYLVDSNIDWGQDVLKLKAFLDRYGNPEICASYFGRADLWYYGVAHRPIPATEDAKGRAGVDCLAAISVTQLYGVYGREGEYEWLRRLTPIRKIGYSIYVYDLRKK